jgi:hypothetical protein
VSCAARVKGGREGRWVAVQGQLPLRAGAGFHQPLTTIQQHKERDTRQKEPHPVAHDKTSVGASGGDVRGRQSGIAG